jgi:arsenate reductase
MPEIDLVAAVCDESKGQNCPDFPRTTTKLQWSFPDPAAFTGTDEEKLERIREVRDAIKSRIKAWCEEVCGTQIA